ncbi:MAG TPA: endonuclease/exonuclease/phosphatase family protein [Candidatus Eisenbacteria bacterium]|nr:endonuclease/exonuclease/phosphatase family protein [Candidatus Eisenbacteria bacterium]
MTVRILSYNIRYGGVGREEALAEVVEAAAPDLVVLQEANRPEVVKRLAERTGMSAWASSPKHSVGFMSRLETRGHEWHRPRGCPRALLQIDLVAGDLTVFGIHLRAIHSNWSERSRARELTLALRSIERHREGIHVLAGDFNTLAPGESLDLRRLPRRLQLLTWILGRTIQWKTIQSLLDAGYVDGFRHLHPDVTGHTFPTWNPHVRLDYFFVPVSAVDRLVSCEVLVGGGSKHASDHFPLLAGFDV